MEAFRFSFEGGYKGHDKKDPNCPEKTTTTIEVIPPKSTSTTEVPKTTSTTEKSNKETTTTTKVEETTTTVPETTTTEVPKTTSTTEKSNKETTTTTKVEETTTTVPETTIEEVRLIPPISVENTTTTVFQPETPALLAETGAENGDMLGLGAIAMTAGALAVRVAQLRARMQ